MRRALGNIRDSWVRRLRSVRRLCGVCRPRGANRFSTRSISCRNPIGRLPVDSSPGGKTMASLHSDTTTSVVMSRLFFHFIPVPRRCLQCAARRGFCVVSDANR